MRISDWSSDVCSSDLHAAGLGTHLLDDNPEWAPIVEEMRTQTSRMAQIVEDLLMLSRLEAQSRPSDESVNMGSLLRTLEREAQALSRGRHQIQLIDDARCDLSGSTKELHSAFSNLEIGRAHV